MMIIIILILLLINSISKNGRIIMTHILTNNHFIYIYKYMKLLNKKLVLEQGISPPCRRLEGPYPSIRLHACILAWLGTGLCGPVRGLFRARKGWG